MKVPVSFRTLHAMADKNILVDSGATDNFIHPKLLKRLGLGAQMLDRPRKIWNIDGTTNRAGQLTSFVDLKVRMRSKEEKMCFLVTDLGNDVTFPYHVISHRCTFLRKRTCRGTLRAGRAGYGHWDFGSRDFERK
jgi:hypothetical protein